MKVMLLFPPNWTPTMPHLALPTLTAFLRSHDVEVIQRDLNLEIFDEILTKNSIEASIDKIKAIYGKNADQPPTDRPLPPQETVLWALNEGYDLAKKVEGAKNIIRSKRFFDGPVGKKAFETVIKALELASLPYYPANLNLQSYTAAGPTDSSKEILKLVKDERFNIFIDFYKRGILKDIIAEKPDVVGIAIPSMPQMLAGMTIAHLIKDAGLDCHITVGGPHISMLREELPKVPRIFELIDSAVVFDGEVPLLELVKAIEAGEDFSKVPNLVYREADKIRVTLRKPPENIADVPMPDFDGLPLGRYLAPYQALPMLTARGCYFGKCAFCNVGYGEAESFSQLRAQTLVDQMHTLKEKYGVRHILFSDEAFTPKTLRGMSAILKEQDSPFHWGGCARFENVMNKELLTNISDAGCRMILYGLESASQPVMDKMIKGTKLDQMHRILTDSYEAGIWNHTFFFFGFPGETIEDAQQTVNFLYEHKGHVNSAALGTFLMERYSPAHRFPKQFGVSNIIEEEDKDLAIYFDYEVESGIDNDTAERIMDGFLDRLPDKQNPQYYVSDVYRFLYASHLKEKGKDLPAWLMPESQAITT